MTATLTTMTRTQKRNLATFVLSHGYDNTCEFWTELVDGTDADLPSWTEAEPMLYAWHARMIEMADQAVTA